MPHTKISGHVLGWMGPTRLQLPKYSKVLSATCHPNVDFGNLVVHVESDEETDPPLVGRDFFVALSGASLSLGVTAVFVGTVVMHQDTPTPTVLHVYDLGEV